MGSIRIESVKSVAKDSEGLGFVSFVEDPEPVEWAAFCSNSDSEVFGSVASVAKIRPDGLASRRNPVASAA
jgi:hypothetical protein